MECKEGDGRRPTRPPHSITSHFPHEIHLTHAYPLAAPASAWDTPQITISSDHAHSNRLAAATFGQDAEYAAVSAAGVEEGEREYGGAGVEREASRDGLEGWGGVSISMHIMHRSSWPSGVLLIQQRNIHQQNYLKELIQFDGEISYRRLKPDCIPTKMIQPLPIRSPRPSGFATVRVDRLTASYIVEGRLTGLLRLLVPCGETGAGEY